MKGGGVTKHEWLIDKSDVEGVRGGGENMKDLKKKNFNYQT